MSGGRNFAFWSYSIIEHLLHPKGLNTHIHPRTQPNLTQFHTKHSDTLWDTLQTPSAHVQTKIKHNQTPTGTSGHQRTPSNAIRRQLETSHILKPPFEVSRVVLGRLLVSVGHFWCPKLSGMSGEGVWEHINEVVSILIGFGSVRGCIWVFRPCRVQEMLYDGIAPRGKIQSTWHFLNIKIPKPPYISSLKITGVANFFHFFTLSEANYNLQSLSITL